MASLSLARVGFKNADSLQPSDQGVNRVDGTHWWGALRVRRTWSHLSLAVRNGQTHISISTCQVYKTREPFIMEVWHLSMFLEEYGFPITQMILALDSESLPWPELGARHCQLPRCDSQNLVFRVGHYIIWSSW